MMDLATLRRMNDAAVAKAKRLRQTPYVIRSTRALNNMPPFPFPNIGSFVPEGWREEEDLRLFVSKTSVDSGPALSTSQLCKRLHELRAQNPKYGYAIVDEGQFQLYIGVFTKE